MHWGTKTLVRLLAATLAIAVYACFPEKSDGSSLEASARKLDHQIDSAIQMLRTGDVVLRMGSDVTSYIFSCLNWDDRRFSHCGVVVEEGGYPFVYHAIGGEDNPDAKLRRDSASRWFSPVHNLGLGIARYPLDTNQIEQLRMVVLELYRSGVRFDMSFDLATDDRLYCAEFIYKALNRVTKGAALITPTQVFSYRYIGIDNLYLNPYARLICQMRYK